MKATLEFNLPEENKEYELSSKAFDMHILIWNLKGKLDTFRKRDGRESVEICEMQAIIDDMLKDGGISHLFE